MDILTQDAEKRFEQQVIGHLTRNFADEEFDGFPASNRNIDIFSFVMYQLKDGKIFRSLNLDDDLTGFVQIGKVILEENDELKVAQYMSQLSKIGLIK